MDNHWLRYINSSYILLVMCLSRKTLLLCLQYHEIVNNFTIKKSSSNALLQCLSSSTPPPTTSLSTTAASRRTGIPPSAAARCGSRGIPAAGAAQGRRAAGRSGPAAKQSGRAKMNWDANSGTAAINRTI